MTKYSKVVVVGRTNVGKSTLFNRLVGQKKSLVFDREGVTRDHISAPLQWEGVTFELVDTGGMIMHQGQDEISRLMRERLNLLLDEAALIVFVVDAKVGLVAADREIARILHATKKPVVVLVNKCDDSAQALVETGEFYALGFEKVMPVSAIHGQGISDLLNYMVTKVRPASVMPEESAYRMVLLGKPNVGKSSLLNLLLREERSIVSDVPGTTREAIHDRLMFHQQAIDIVDTAGVRRQKKVDDSLEELMVKSSLQAVRDADIVLIMVDASEKRLLDQELKLLFYAYEQKKGVVLIFNKCDLLDDIGRDELEYNISEYEFILKKIPVIYISCVSKKNLGRVMQVVDEVWKRMKQVFDPADVEEYMRESLFHRPMYAKNELIRVWRVRPVPARVPTFTVHVADVSVVGESHLGHLENLLRKHYDLKGCPVNLILRGQGV